MATFVVDGDQLVLKLSWLELWRRSGATFTCRCRPCAPSRSSTDFAAILGKRPAVRVELDSPSPFARLLVSVENVAATAETIRRAASIEPAAAG